MHTRLRSVRAAVSVDRFTTQCAAGCHGCAEAVQGRRRAAACRCCAGGSCNDAGSDSGVINDTFGQLLAAEPLVV